MATAFRWIFQKLAYFLYARPRLVRDDTAEVLGFRLTIPAGVFHPVLFQSSLFFAGYLSRQPLNGREVLEMGCGSGVLSLTMARSGARVTACDINPGAVSATRENARTNGVNVEARVSDLFGSLDRNRRYDMIVWNPPFYEGDPVSLADHAWRAGRGLGVIRKFALQAASFLLPGGKAVLSVSSEMDLGQLGLIFRESGWEMREVESRRWLFERLIVYEFQPLS